VALLPALSHARYASKLLSHNPDASIFRKVKDDLNMKRVILVKLSSTNAQEPIDFCHCENRIAIRIILMTVVFNYLRDFFFDDHASAEAHGFTVAPNMESPSISPCSSSLKVSLSDSKIIVFLSSYKHL
jgi:hypothetical protein